MEKSKLLTSYSSKFKIPEYTYLSLNMIWLDKEKVKEMRINTTFNKGLIDLGGMVLDYTGGMILDHTIAPSGQGRSYDFPWIDMEIKYYHNPSLKEVLKEVLKDFPSSQGVLKDYKDAKERGEIKENYLSLEETKQNMIEAAKEVNKKLDEITGKIKRDAKISKVLYDCKEGSTIAFKSIYSGNWYTGHIKTLYEPKSKYNSKDTWEVTIYVNIPIEPQWYEEDDKTIFFYEEIEDLVILER